MTNHDLAVRRLHRRIIVQLLLKNALPTAAAWCFLWGTAILAARVLWNASPLMLLWGFAALVPLVGLSLMVAWRRLPSKASLRALVDSRSHCGGLVVAADECQLRDWQERVPPAVQLRVNWANARRATTFLGAAIAYALVALLVPDRMVDANFQDKLQISKEAEQLGENIQLLKEEKLVEEERAASLQEQLEQIKDQASGRNPDKTFQALDHLSELMKRTANDAGNKGVRDTERLAKAEALAEALQKNAGDIDNKMKTDAMNELKRLLEESELENAVSQAFDDKGLLRDLDAGSLTPDQLKQLAKALKGSKKDIADLLKKLADAKLVDGEFCTKCDKAGKCDGDALGKMMCDKDGDLSLQEMLALCQRPGRGGLTCGRGDAPLVYGKESDEQGVKFKEQILPPGSVASLKDAKLLAISKSSPETEKGGTQSTGGALNNAAAGGGAGISNVLLPQHRGVVQRYFERQDPNAKKD